MNKRNLICLLVIIAFAGFCGGLFFDRSSYTPSAYAQSHSSVSIQWEPINHDSGSRMERAKIPAGWIVRAGGGDTIAFVPDPGHSWK